MGGQRGGKPKWAPASMLLALHAATHCARALSYLSCVLSNPNHLSCENSTA